MDKRLKLQEELEVILGTKNVYFQPPENLKMTYPAIRYGMGSREDFYADDFKYKTKVRYDVTLIDRDPESSFVDEILKLPYSSFDRTYVADNLHHFIINIYF